MRERTGTGEEERMAWDGGGGRDGHSSRRKRGVITRTILVLPKFKCGPTLIYSYRRSHSAIPHSISPLTISELIFHLRRQLVAGTLSSPVPRHPALRPIQPSQPLLSRAIPCPTFLCCIMSSFTRTSRCCNLLPSPKSFTRPIGFGLSMHTPVLPMPAHDFI